MGTFAATRVQERACERGSLIVRPLAGFCVALGQGDREVEEAIFLSFRPSGYARRKKPEIALFQSRVNPCCSLMYLYTYYNRIYMYNSYLYI